jgi:cholesterol oxidase
MNEERFDVVVVGSGFGGSVSASRLAEGGRTVCLLERGKRYPPGSFPRAPADVRDNFWDPSEKLYGLFDPWSFDHFEAVVSSGLGGGSLIYANVLIRKDEKWFVNDRPGGGYDPWPISRADLDPHYDEVERRLGAAPYPFGNEPYRRTPKTLAMRQAASELRLDWKLPNLAVTFASRPGAPPVTGEPIVEPPNLHQRTRLTCRLCGECDVGCNYGSKNTLDFNYLTAAANAGAVIRDLCEVRSFEPEPGGYAVHYVKHEPGGETPSSELPLRTVHAGRLILGAGAFGTTYLLLKNRASLPALSRRLGTAFSGNGDLLGICQGARDERMRPRRLDPEYGPSITSAIRIPDRLDGGQGGGHYVEDGGIPAFAEWMIETLDVPGGLRRAIGFAVERLRARASSEPRSGIGAELRRALGEARTSSGTLIMLAMGRDTPDGVMSLKGRWLQVDWSKKTSEAYFDGVRRTMKAVAGRLGADFRDNPLWYLKRTVTVHPLGGCPMGASAAAGVVDELGEAFGHPGLYVLDGSAMPGPVGPNPSLTIAAFADRAADRILGG